VRSDTELGVSATRHTRRTTHDAPFNPNTPKTLNTPNTPNTPNNPNQRSASATSLASCSPRARTRGRRTRRGSHRPTSLSTAPLRPSSSRSVEKRSVEKRSVERRVDTNGYFRWYQRIMYMAMDVLGSCTPVSGVRGSVRTGPVQIGRRSQVSGRVGEWASVQLGTPLPPRVARTRCHRRALPLLDCLCTGPGGGA